MLGVVGYLVARTFRSTINRRSSASDPIGLRMSEVKLKRLCPSLYFSSGVRASMRCFFWDGLALRYVIRDMLVHGDSRAAVVLSISPLLIACYCDDLDGVCVLRFCDKLAQEFGLQPNSRLVTVLNSRCRRRPARSEELARDVIQGSAANPRYVNFWPLIAEFLSDDTALIEARKKGISDDEYHRCQAFGKEHLRCLGVQHETDVRIEAAPRHRNSIAAEPNTSAGHLRPVLFDPCGRWDQRVEGPFP